MTLDDWAFFRLFEAVARQAHRDAAGRRQASYIDQVDALQWLAAWQGCDVTAVKVAPADGRRYSKMPFKGGKVKTSTGTEHTAAERLATAQAGLQRLRSERTEATDLKRAAQGRYDELDARLAELHRRGDAFGEDVAAEAAALAAERTEAARQTAAASAGATELDRRMRAVQDELPRLEALALQDELAVAVAAGADVARRYRAALEDAIAAGVQLQAALGQCERLGGAIFERGLEPAHKLRAHIVQGAELDRVLTVARNAGDGAATAATRRLFERWGI